MSNSERVNEEMRNLYKRYLDNECSIEDISLLIEYFGNPDENDLHLLILNELEKTEVSRTPTEEEDQSSLQIFERLQKITDGTHKRKSVSFLIRVSAASIILLAVTGVIILFKIKKNINKLPVAISRKENVIQPGHSGAVLKLSDGRILLLDSAKDGALATQSNERIIKKGNQIQYAETSGAVEYNTISTTAGREWMLVLPDGTKVWLNAQSSITYPTSFKGHERVVSVIGEVYFEVVHNSSLPFKVNTGSATIEDIGTAFNIKNYPEDKLKTTLAEGRVKVLNDGIAKILVPGQQAIATKNRIETKNVNVYDETAWRNGFFSFHNTELKDIMSQIGRWYNVTVTYQGNITTDLFSGKISRNAPISKVLDMLQEGGVHIKIKAETVDGHNGEIIILP